MRWQGPEGPKAPTLGQYVRVHAPLVACDTWLCALVYCNFLKKVRLGGRRTEGPKAPTLGQYVSACATFPLGSGSIYLVLRLG